MIGLLIIFQNLNLSNLHPYPNQLRQVKEIIVIHQQKLLKESNRHLKLHISNLFKSEFEFERQNC
jgi:hypothetical protein